jgi:hypothetical protein
MDELLTIALRIAGAGQLALCALSFAIPRVLGWRGDLAKLRVVNRQIFWVYAAYIFCFHLCFGLLGLLGADLLLDQSILATVVCGFIAVYWLARLVIQFTWFDRSDAPQGLRFKLAEALLVCAFAAFAGAFGWAFVFNLMERQ